jgi:hypothetical protein
MRPGADDFDTASFSTYNAETEELEQIGVLAKRLKRVFYGD